MTDSIILTLALLAVAAFFFFLINRDVHKVEKGYFLKQKRKKQKSHGTAPK